LNSPLEPSTSFPNPWKPTIWGANNIAEIETIACRSILTMSAKFRTGYLRNFYDLNRLNSQFGANPSQPIAYVIPAGQGNEEIVSRFIEILLGQGIEVYKMNRELKTSIAGSAEVHTEIPLDSFMIFLDQPQRSNVEALLAKQVYPQRLNANGEAEVPYDVAGWTLPLQMGIESYPVTQIVEYPNSARKLEKIEDINKIRQTLNLDPAKEAFAKLPNPIKNQVKIGIYKGFTAAIDEGWTRQVFDTFQIKYQTISDADFRTGNLNVEVIILPSQSENEIVNGLKKDTYPDEFVGGITEQGVANLRKFVENGGRLICFDESCSMIIKQFNLPIKNVLSGLKRSEFYCPGSILNLDIDKTRPLAKGFGKTSAAYFINSSAFEITDETKVKSIAKYADKNALLSGWLLGEKYLNGKTALAETDFGKGKIILFAFRPQHRGQSFATYPFIFNGLEK
jgi:hypothetical protein